MALAAEPFVLLGRLSTTAYISVFTSGFFIVVFVSPWPHRCPISMEEGSRALFSRDPVFYTAIRFLKPF